MRISNREFVLVPGRLEPKKNLPNLLRAYAAFRDLQLLFHLAWSGPALAAMPEDHADALGRLAAHLVDAGPGPCLSLELARRGGQSPAGAELRQGDGASGQD